jgi:low affinity Fe/Cu permease
MSKLPEPRPYHRAVHIARETAAQHSGMRLWFSSFATKSSSALGSPFAFFGAIAIVVIWALMGPMYHYSNTWQLVINTGTTIITFLMVFLIQSTQNRDAKAIHLKLNELIHGTKHAQDELIDVEKLSDEELKKLDEHYGRIREECERRRAQGKSEDAA